MTISTFHVVPSLHPSYGGPARTVTSLADHLAELDGVKVTVFSQGDIAALEVSSSNSVVEREVGYSSSKFCLTLGLPVYSALRRRLTQSPPDIIHSHGVWAPVNHWATKLSREYNIPLVCHPRGMLENWSIHYKPIRKKFAMMAYQMKDLKSVSSFVATSQMEIDAIRGLGLTQPIALIPNGVDFASETPPLRHANGQKTALFLSRIHPKKGLIDLIQAWAYVKPRNWRLIIAGPDQDNHLSEVRAEIDKYELIDCVHYVGEVADDAKSKLFGEADLFVLPTYSENFGVVVAEALSYGIPVLTTKGAPWRDLERYQCGWCIEIGTAHLIRALRESTEMPIDELSAMGRRGMEYVQRYDWRIIANDTVRLYRALLLEREFPKCVQVS